MPFLLKTVSLFDILNTEYYNKGELTMDALQQIKEQICDVCHKMWQHSEQRTARVQTTELVRHTVLSTDNNKESSMLFCAA